MNAPRWLMIALPALLAVQAMAAMAGRGLVAVYMALCPICNLARLLMWLRAKISP